EARPRRASGSRGRRDNARSGRGSEQDDEPEDESWSPRRSSPRDEPQPPSSRSGPSGPYRSAGYQDEGYGVGTYGGGGYGQHGPSQSRASGRSWDSAGDRTRPARSGYEGDSSQYGQPPFAQRPMAPDDNHYLP